MEPGTLKEETQLTCKSLRLTLVALLLAAPGLAAEREVIRADWSGFRQQVSMRKLLRRNVRVTLSGGGEIKSTLVRVEDNGLIVKATKAAKQWASGPEQATIPREQVSAVRFGGRIGHRGLIGGLVGLGAGVAIPLVIAASREDPYAVLGAPPLGLIGGTAGYLIGHFTDRPAPEFVIK
jgi:hypothetical protein